MENIVIWLPPKTKEEAMAQLAETIRKVPAERAPEVSALVAGFVAGIEQAEKKGE